MRTSINLAITKDVKNTVGLYFKLILGGFGVVFIFSLIFVAINIAFSAQLSSLNLQEQSLMQNLESMQDKKLKVLTVSERLQNIKNVVQLRGNMDKRIESILTVVNPGMNVSAINADDDTVTLEVKIQNLAQVQSLFDVNMKRYLKENPMHVQSVMIDNMKADSGIYTVKVSFIFSVKSPLNG